MLFYRRMKGRKEKKPKTANKGGKQYNARTKSVKETRQRFVRKRKKCKRGKNCRKKKNGKWKKKRRKGKKRKKLSNGARPKGTTGWQNRVADIIVKNRKWFKRKLG